MRWLHQILYRLQPFFRRKKIEADLDEEIRSHLELQAEANRAAGLTPEEAERAAQRQCGGIAQAKEAFRDQRGIPWLENFLRDLGFGGRQLWKNPGFAAVAVLTLALGIGVNTAVFTLVYALNYSPRPFAHPEELVQLYTQDRKNPESFRAFSYPTYRDLAESGSQFSGILAHRNVVAAVGDGPGARRTFSAVVSANFFEVLGVKLVEGRSFTTAEEAPGNGVPVVVASYVYWKKTGFDPALVGSTLRVNERPYTVVGITPENFSGTTALFGPEFYFPIGQYDELTAGLQAGAAHTLERRDSYLFFLVGRLKPGISLDSARAALGAAAVNLERACPVVQKDQTFILGPLPRDNTSDAPPGQRNGLALVGFLFLGMAGIVLLIASLNLANLLLARSAARRKEFAIRLALGGGRGRLIRQLLTEGIVLAAAGGILGLILAAWSTDLLASSLALIIPETVFFPGTGNPAILTATVAFSVVSTLVFALGPAMKFSRRDVITDLKEQAGEDVQPRRRWLPRNPLVVAQIALSLGLLTCAGLFLRGAFEAGRADLGFSADNTLVVESDAGLGGYDEARALQIYRDIGERLAALPGVESASIATFIPFGFSSDGASIRRAGLVPAPDARPSTAAEGLAFNARWNSVGADYFTTLGLSLVRGRPFTAAEATAKGAPPVAIIDEALARKLWPDGDALGQRIQYGYEKTAANTMEVVGIVPAVRTSLFREAGAAVYVPFAQGFRAAVDFHIRTRANTLGAAAGLIDSVRREVRAAAPALPIFKVRTFRQHLDASGDLWIVRAGAALLGVFGLLALVLAVVGLYGVKAYSVARRTREIGIRMALGAEPAQVLSMVLGEGLVMILTGTGFGLLLALGLGRLCASLLFQVSPFDPLAFTIAPAVLVLTAMVACYLPAWRAARVDPLVALRAE
jgi:predicted permease